MLRLCRVGPGSHSGGRSLYQTHGIQSAWRFPPLTITKAMRGSPGPDILQ